MILHGKLRTRSWGCDGQVSTGLPDLRTSFAVPTEAKDVLTRLQMLWHAEVVIHRDVVLPHTSAIALVQLCRRVIRVSWLNARRLKRPILRPISPVYARFHVRGVGDAQHLPRGPGGRGPVRHED